MALTIDMIVGSKLLMRGSKRFLKKRVRLGRKQVNGVGGNLSEGLKEKSPNLFFLFLYLLISFFGGFFTIAISSLSSISPEKEIARK